MVDYQGEKTINNGSATRPINYSFGLSAATDTPLVGLKPSQIKMSGKHWKDGDIEPTDFTEVLPKLEFGVTDIGYLRTWLQSNGMWISHNSPASPIPILSAETLDVPLSAVITSSSGKSGKGKYHIVANINIDQ